VLVETSEELLYVCPVDIGCIDRQRTRNYAVCAKRVDGAEWRWSSDKEAEVDAATR
jgi:hypothetical protein